MNNVISVKGLTKEFDAVTVLNNISLDVIKGEIIGLFGSNGAEKNNTFKIAI